MITNNVATSDNNAESVGNSVTLSITSGVPVAGSMVSTLFSNSHSSGTFTSNFFITWTGQASGSNLTLSIPQNSIDTTVVPEPSSALLLLCGSAGFVALLAWRKVRAS